MTGIGATLPIGATAAAGIASAGAVAGAAVVAGADGQDPSAATGDGYKEATPPQVLMAPVKRIPGEPSEVVRLAEIQIELEALDEQLRDAVAIHNAGVPNMPEIERLRGLKRTLLAEQAIMVVRNNPVATIIPADLLTTAEKAAAAAQEAAKSLAMRPLTMSERVAAAFRALGADMVQYPMRHGFHLLASAEVAFALDHANRIFEARSNYYRPIPELTAMSGVAALIGGAVYLGSRALYYLRTTEAQRHVHRVDGKNEGMNFLTACGLAAGSFALAGGVLITNPMVGGILGVGIFAVQLVAYWLLTEGDHEKAVREAQVALREKKEQQIREGYAAEVQRIQALDAETLMREAAKKVGEFIQANAYDAHSTGSSDWRGTIIPVPLNQFLDANTIRVIQPFFTEDLHMQRVRELGAPMATQVFQWYYSEQATADRLMTVLYLSIHQGHHAESVLPELRRIRDEAKNWYPGEMNQFGANIDFTIAHIETEVQREANRRRFTPPQ